MGLPWKLWDASAKLFWRAIWTHVVPFVVVRLAKVAVSRPAYLALHVEPALQRPHQAAAKVSLQGSVLMGAQLRPVVLSKKADLVLQLDAAH